MFYMCYCTFEAHTVRESSDRLSSYKAHLNPSKGRAEIAKILIAHGLDASDRHNDGYTPIHRACWGREARHTETGF